MDTRRLPIARRVAAAPAAALVVLLALPAVACAQQDDRVEISAEEAARRPDHVVVRVVGRAYDISRDGRRFRVEVGEVGFTVEPGFATRFPTLREGDRVLVLGTLTSQTRLTARDVRVLGTGTPRAFTGIVQNIDRRRSRLTVRSDDDAVIAVEWTVDTLFARLGRRVTAEQIRAGDEVWVDGRWLGTRLIRATRVEVTASRDRWQSGQTGEIAEISRRDRQLRVAFGDETRLVIVTPDTSITAQGRSLPFDSLMERDRVRVSGELRDDAVIARGIEVIERSSGGRTVEGRVRGIDLEERILRVTVNSIIPITVRVYLSADTPISRGTRRLTISDIREGDRIRARGPSRDSGIQAEAVELLP